MARYANDLAPAGPANETLQRIADYLVGEGFRKTEGSVWQKGAGWLVSPQFISVELRDSRIHVEAWLPFALLPRVYVGEMDLEGAFGLIPKRRLRGRVEAIERLVTGARPRAE